MPWPIIKNLGVLGARGVGKTHLVKFLSTGYIPVVEYKQTIAPAKTSARTFQLREMEPKVQKTLDVSGDKSAYAEWKKLHDEADVVLYLLRADRLIARDRDVEARVRADLKHIGEWSEANRRPHFFIIGTHCDLDPEYQNLSANIIGDYRDKFLKLPIVQEIIAHAGGAQLAKVILGRMDTVEGTEQLVHEVFKQVIS